VFRYQAGREYELIDVFIEKATDPGDRFNWSDAAVLSYQIGRRKEEELEELRGGEVR